jgi:hypothetical protein
MTTCSLAGRTIARDYQLTTQGMAWRPYQNLINGELDNTTPGKVTGFIRFFREGNKPLRVSLDLSGDFHEDIRGKIIRLKNSEPSDKNRALEREGTYMKGFAPIQRGKVGDITAGLSLGPWTEARAQQFMAQNELYWDEVGLKGTEREERRKNFADSYKAHIDAGDLFYPYVKYPYVEWYSNSNWRVVLELDPSQLEILPSENASIEEKTPEELLSDDSNRDDAAAIFQQSFVESAKTVKKVVTNRMQKP